MEYQVVYTVKDLPEFSPDYPTFCDIETDGLYINTRLIQYYQPQTSKTVYILDCDYFGEHTKEAQTQDAIFKALGKTRAIKVTREDIRELHSKLHLVWWNGSYDQGTLRVPSKEVDDLWYMAKLALPQLDEFNLDKVTDYLFPGKKFYGGLDKKALQKARFRPGPLSEDQLRYSATDVYVMSFIWDKLYPKVGDAYVYRLDKLNLAYTVIWQQTGLKVNADDRQKAEEEFKVKLKELTAKLPQGLNVNSYQQVRALLTWADNGWDKGMTVPEMTKRWKIEGGVSESDASYLLHRIADGCPYSRGIIDKRGVIKTLNFLDTYNRDKVYAHYNPYGTRTGRWSCKGGDREGAANLQQLPRKLKHVFGYREDEPMVLVGADLPTAELRLAAAIYVDDNMLYAFKNSIDIHKLTASKTLGCDVEEVTSDQRKKAKAENFGLLYGMKANKFMQYAFDNYDIVLTEEEAETRRTNWMNTYPGIRDTISRITREFFSAKDKGEQYLVSTPLGRWVKPDLYTDALNIPIQGAVAELAKLWIHYLWKMHGKDTLPIANFVHDSITVECLESEAGYWEDLLLKSCAKAWEEYCKLPMIKVKDIPMPIEVGISKNYGGAS